MKFALAALTVFGMASAYGQMQDNSQNGLLKGKYNFRHIAVLNTDINNDPSEIASSFGTITFDGAGNYTLTGTVLDNGGTVASGSLSVTTGTYAIGSNGLGYIVNPLFPTDTYDWIFGAVSQGVFAGSSTEAYSEGYVLNDIFIAIPAGANPTTASFTSAYQAGLLDFSGGAAAAIKNALIKMSPDGKGGLGTITLSGQASNQSNPSLTQTISGGTYAFNADGSATLTVPLPSGNVPSANALFSGTKTMFESADGNFVLGWTTGGYDIFFGVKAISGASTKTSAGLYFMAALEDAPGTGFGTDSYYGGDSNTGDTAGDAIIHERLNFPGFYSEDFGINDQISVNADGTGTDGYYNFAFGASGNAWVAIGTLGEYSLVVGLHSATFSGSGVYLNPIGVVNAASYQPVTASIAPGELLTLVGTNLSSGSQTTQGGQKFPTSLGGVSVTMNGILCPIYYVTPGQIAVIAPYGINTSTTFLANIIVTNNGVASNMVQVYITDAAPGAFSQHASGIGLGSALHALTGQLITNSNPAQPGEYISLYLTGLGTVSPSISDGALGPTSTLSTADVNTAGNLTVNFNDITSGSFGNAGTITYAGLAPGLAGLYQINVQVPTSGLTAGDVVEVEFVTDYGDFSQVVIPYVSSSGISAVPARRDLAKERALAVRSRQPRSASMRKSRATVDIPRGARP